NPPLEPPPPIDKLLSYHGEDDALNSENDKTNRDNDLMEETFIFPGMKKGWRFDKNFTDESISIRLIKK
ncbi:hypothetical protein GcC1_146016, partial [Golovinomyces cichoracearum]